MRYACTDTVPAGADAVNELVIHPAVASTVAVLADARRVTTPLASVNASPARTRRVVPAVWKEPTEVYVVPTVAGSLRLYALAWPARVDVRASDDVPTAPV